MNTKFSYLYRDACNYKQFGEAVLAGGIPGSRFTPFLIDQQYFIPSEVGLPDLQEGDLTIDDHTWHEVETIEPTDEAPTVKMRAATLLARFKAASKGGWDDTAVCKRKGIL